MEISISNEKYNITRIVNQVYHSILHDYIARANEREVMEKLYYFYSSSDIALINKVQLRQYQELERLTLAKFPIIEVAIPFAKYLEN